MKNKGKHHRSSASLPSFLDPAAAPADAPANQAPADGLEEVTNAAATEVESTTPAAEGTPDEVDPAAAGMDPTVAETQATPPEAPTGPTAAATRRRDSRATEPARASGGAAWFAAGALCLAAGAASAALGGLPAIAALQPIAPPATLLLGGLVLLAQGSARRRQGRLEAMLGDATATSTTAQIAADLQALVSAQQAAEARAPAAGEELQHVLLALQRQDEKLNNLTKAIKMHGKPLMEIAAQTTELQSSLGAVRSAVEGQQQAAEPVRQALGAVQKDLQQVVATSRELLGRPAPAPVSLDPVQQHVQRVEVAVQAIAQRLDATEVQKSLLRLEDQTQKLQKDLQTLVRGESVQQATAQLQDRVDQSARKLQDGLQQLREGNLGGIEAAVREVMREVSGVATAVAQIQAAVKNAPRPMAAGASAAPAGPATPAAESAPSPTAPAPVAAATPAASPAPTTGEAPVAGGYQTGTRNSSGKNLLGAIAKLKQMKG